MLLVYIMACRLYILKKLHQHAHYLHWVMNIYAVEIALACNIILLIEGHQRRCEVRYSDRRLHTL